MVSKKKKGMRKEEGWEWKIGEGKIRRKNSYVFLLSSLSLYLVRWISWLWIVNRGLRVLDLLILVEFWWRVWSVLFWNRGCVGLKLDRVELIVVNCKEYTAWSIVLFFWVREFGESCEVESCTWKRLCSIAWIESFDLQDLSSILLAIHSPGFGLFFSRVSLKVTLAITISLTTLHQDHLFNLFSPHQLDPLTPQEALSLLSWIILYTTPNYNLN